VNNLANDNENGMQCLGSRTCG